MTTLNEIVETFQNRLKSPILGSIFLSFIALNWKPLVYVFFETGESFLIRFKYFEDNTSIWTMLFCPIIFGFLLTTLLPLMNYAVAWIVRKPILLHKHMNEKTRSNLELARLTNKSINDEKVRQELEKQQGLYLIEKQKILGEAKIEDELEGIKNPEVKQKAKDRLEKMGKAEPAIRTLSDLVNMGVHYDIASGTTYAIAKIITDYDEGIASEDDTVNQLRAIFTFLKEDLHGASYAGYMKSVHDWLPEKLRAFKKLGTREERAIRMKSLSDGGNQTLAIFEK